MLLPTQVHAEKEFKIGLSCLKCLTSKVTRVSATVKTAKRVIRTINVGLTDAPAVGLHAVAALNRGLLTNIRAASLRNRLRSRSRLRPRLRLRPRSLLLLEILLRRRVIVYGKRRRGSRTTHVERARLLIHARLQQTNK